jgi:hypothetical protein
MKMRQLFLACSLLAVVVTAAASTAPTHVTKPAKVGVAQADKPAVLKRSKLGAAEIVERNVAARGGLKAWRAVQTLTLSGQLEAGGTRNTPLPFVMEMKRPHKSRLEIRFSDQTAMQVYDGEQGWKVRPFLNRIEAEPFTPDQARLAATWADLDGPLVDYARKGNKVSVEGMEVVEGRDTYRLKLTQNGGTERRIWIDAATFLEAKIDGDPRKMDGKWHQVAVYYRDYRPENGLLMPHVLETVVEGVRQTHKMTIDQVAVNRPLEDSLFAKPQLNVAAAADR